MAVIVLKKTSALRALDVSHFKEGGEIFSFSKFFCFFKKEAKKEMGRFWFFLQKTTRQIFSEKISGLKELAARHLLKEKVEKKADFSEDYWRKIKEKK